MNILITGGSGFIGSNLANTLEKEKNFDVTIIDNFSSGKKDNLKTFRGNIINSDIIDIDKSEKLKGAKKFDVIYHEASITDTTFPDDSEMMRQNIEGFKTALRIAQKNNAKFVYISSAAVYGNVKTPMKEDGPTEPLNAYAKSKLEIDKIAKNYHDKMHIVGLRYFNVFGPGEEFKASSMSMIRQLAVKMLRGENPRLFSYGEQKRDHIYVKDVVKATILAASAKKSGVYNVGTGKATTFNELFQILNKKLKTDYQIQYFDNPIKKVYQVNTQAYIKNAEKYLGFRCDYDITSGIADYLPYIRKTMD